MKYYIYISETKVEMLFPQIEKHLKGKTSIDFAVDLKFFKTSRKTERTATQSIYDKCEAVCSHIIANCNVGDIRNPRDYIYDTLEMRWGILTYDYEIVSNASVMHELEHEHDHFYNKLMNNCFVMFSSIRGKEIYVALTGSVFHLVGNKNLQPKLLDAYSYKGTPSWDGFLRGIQSQIDVNKSSDEDEYFKALHAAFHCANNSLVTISPKAQPIEFLAKTLLISERGGPNGTRIIVGTPIYTALSTADKVSFN